MNNNNQTQLPNMAPPKQETQSPNKKRKGIFPRLPLKKTLELPKAIYAVGQGEQVRRLKVFDHLGKKPESGPSRLLVSVSTIYGLTVGGYQAEYLELTEIGRKLAENENITLIFDVLFKNEIFSEFIEYWKDKAVPMDDIAIDWLQRKFNLNSEDAKSFWSVIKENIFDYHLTEHLSGRQVIVSKEEVLQSRGSATTPTEIFTPVQQQDIPQKISNGLPISEKKISPAASETADIKLENGGLVRITMYREGVITKTDAKKMKAQVDIYSNFIDQEK